MIRLIPVLVACVAGSLIAVWTVNRVAGFESDASTVAICSAVAASAAAIAARRRRNRA